MVMSLLTLPVVVQANDIPRLVLPIRLMKLENLNKVEMFYLGRLFQLNSDCLSFTSSVILLMNFVRKPPGLHYS